MTKSAVGRDVMEFENKLGIEDKAQLALEEERIAKVRAIEIFDSKDLDGIEVGTYTTLANIHRYLLDEIYDFAGELRTSNNSAENVLYTPVMFLGAAIKNITLLPQDTFEEIVFKFTEMSMAHPFFEGNGRAMRIWLDDMLKKGIGRAVDWSAADKEDYLLAMERRPVRDTEIKALFAEALTDAIRDRGVFVKGTHASYAYEGYGSYGASQL